MQKCSKSDVRKTWRGIFISYTRMTKHLRVWAPRTHQVFIASEPIVNESEKDTNLFIEHPLPLAKKPLRPQIGEPKPRGQPHKSNFEKIIEDCGKSGKRSYYEDVAIEENTSGDELV